MTSSVGEQTSEGRLVVLSLCLSLSMGPVIVARPAIEDMVDAATHAYAVAILGKFK